MSELDKAGYHVFEATEETRAWAGAAHKVACDVTKDPAQRALWLRHQNTWFVGVDALPNDPDGSISNVPLKGPWKDHIVSPTHWHKAQISVVYEGYPKQDKNQSDANHRFRVNRAAAHVDGLLLEDGKRYLREPHAFILGISLNESDAAPLKVWPGSHRIMGPALARALGLGPDLTEAYKAARAEVFESIAPVDVALTFGQSVLLDRHILHGMSPWEDGQTAPIEGRMTAYFRPQFDDFSDWLPLF
ncbi:hypothetical protein [Planktotalea frisia]|uniref:hypothetical protein n=1 Tax=Planktotalea frisia TaxID=696762 RepID=UPI002352FBE1|nr:hypothetical protein [Planktotalea frisia]